MWDYLWTDVLLPRWLVFYLLFFLALSLLRQAFDLYPSIKKTAKETEK